MPTAIRRRAARQIALSTLCLPEVRAARRVALYADFRHEVPTSRLGLLLGLAGKIVALPVMDQREKCLRFRQIDHRHQLAPGPYGIREPGPGCPPIAPDELDLILLPGVGFDRRGFRLGYGGGYYDRFLPYLAATTVTVGLAYSCQVVPILPHGAFDRPVDLVVTEDEVITVPSALRG